MNQFAEKPERPDIASRSIGWWQTATLSWVAIGFFAALALAAIVLATFGAGERGTGLALRLTARWSFLLFWLAYTGSAMAKLFGRRFAALESRGRDFGFSYASAQVVHVGLVLWIIYRVPGQNGGMVFFWVGILCTYLLVLFSWPKFREAMGPQLWRMFRAVAIEYIMLAFATDFILIPLQSTRFGKYSLLTYLPFALLLVGGVGLRVAAAARYRLLLHKTA